MPQLSPQSADDLTHREFEIAVKRLANNLLFGEDLSPFVGSGVDYVQSRLYVPGDSIKDMDWRVTARTGRHHIKEYEIPKSMPIYVLFDTSASMSVSSLGLSKYALGLQIVGALAISAADRQSPVGIITAGRTHFRSPPTLSRAKIMQALHQLRQFNFNEPTHVADRLDELSALMQHRGLIAVVSDLHDPNAVDAIKRISQEHDVVTIQMKDPAEAGGLRGGYFRGTESETGHTFTGSGRSVWMDHAAVVAGELQAAGIDHLLVQTDQPVEAPLRRFLKNRGGGYQAER